MYRIDRVTFDDGEVVENIVRIEDGAAIPADEGNRDYVHYRAWCAEGNAAPINDSGAKLPEYYLARAAAYKSMMTVGDQLDAILKTLNQLRTAGTKLPADTESLIGKWLAIKQKFPKE